MKTPAPVVLSARPLSVRRGLTLMELLIAVTISLMVMGATVTLFGVVGDKINAGRALIEMSDHVRSAENRLRQDLEGATASFLPWEQPSAASGYFEILKGPYTTNVNTSNRDALPGAANVLLGYRQDVLMFTTRSTGEPFTGRFLLPNGNATTIESPVAEVVWYLQPTFNSQNLTTNPLTYTLYRRQFLIYPSPTPINVGTTQAGLISFYDNYDISAHSDGQGNMYANSLADLSYRENRFAHNPAKAPFFVKYIPFTAPPNIFTFDAFSLTPFQPTYLSSGATNKNGSQRFGEDVVLTNVLSFDVKVWDPGAQVLYDPNDPASAPLVPSDPGYANGKAFSPVQYGAYVDLNYFGSPINNGINTPPDYFAGPFYGNGMNSGLAATSNGGYATYDSWSAGYEYYNGALQGNQVADQAANGLDNDGQNGVNDPNERLTCPPYPVPLRGVQVKIRVYEPSSRQVREVTIVQRFLPD